MGSGLAGHGSGRRLLPWRDAGRLLATSVEVFSRLDAGRRSWMGRSLSRMGSGGFLGLLAGTCSCKERRSSERVAVLAGILLLAVSSSLLRLGGRSGLDDFWRVGNRSSWIFRRDIFSL